MEVVRVDEPGAPGPGEVLVAPEAVGLCGSDFHYFLGDIGTIDDPSVLYPRVQGHEASGTILSVGADCPPGLVAGERVAIWPVVSCGRCYACRVGRGNACANISLIGVHQDGALGEQLLLPAAQVFPVGDQDPALAALIEPVSIAVRAVVRGRVAAGEHVVVERLVVVRPVGDVLQPLAPGVEELLVHRGCVVVLLDELELDVAAVGQRDRRRRRRRVGAPIPEPVHLHPLDEEPRPDALRQPPRHRRLDVVHHVAELAERSEAHAHGRLSYSARRDDDC
jgi:hypothetical protein